MISFFPDLNVWIALSVSSHIHSGAVWNWLDSLPGGSRLIFSRYTQIGLLRLLTNPAVMGQQILTLRQAWVVYDQWLSDPRVEFHPEPRSLEEAFREATSHFGKQPASKWVGDYYLLAYAKETDATLVTFDSALLRAARARHWRAVLPA
jgi:uncharacterized protein